MLQGQSYIVDGCDVLDGTSAKPLYTTDIQDLSKSGLSRKAVLVRDAETGLEIPLMPIPDASGPSSFCSRRAVVDGHTFEWHTSSPEGSAPLLPIKSIDGVVPAKLLKLQINSLSKCLCVASAHKGNSYLKTLP